MNTLLHPALRTLPPPAHGRCSALCASPLAKTLGLLLFLYLWCAFLHPGPCQAQNTTPTTPELHLTLEEKAFLAANPRLRMGIGVAFPPFQFVEHENGRPLFRGLVAEIAQLLEQRLGVHMEPVYGITFAEALDLGKAGSIDVFPCLSWTPERAEFLTYTTAYLNYPLVIISREDSPFISSVDDLQGRKVAEVKVLSTYSKLRNEYPHLSIEYVFEKDTQAMLEAVSFGKADACIVDLAVASYVINTRGLSNLKVAAPTHWKENQLAMAVPKDRAILAGILQKALDSIAFSEMDTIRQHWLGLRYSSLVNPVLFRQILLHGGGTAAIVVAVILWRNRRLEKEIVERKRTEERLYTLNKELEAIFSSVNVGITMLDPRGHYILTNRWWKDFLGYDSEEMLNHPFESITHPHDLDASWECFNAVAQGVQPKNRCEKRYVRKDKSIVWADLSISAVCNETGEVAHVLCVVNDITERKLMEIKLQELATTDSLTGLYNRRHFMELGQRLVSTAIRYDSSLAVAMVDIDHFKAINDSWGHEAGDTVLARLGLIARSCFRSVDVVGRFGGEEFAVLMPETDLDQAHIAVERFRQTLASTPILYAKISLRVTVSCGVAFTPHPSASTDESLETLLKRADDALYRAKRSGKNKVEIAVLDEFFP